MARRQRPRSRFGLVCGPGHRAAIRRVRKIRGGVQREVSIIRSVELARAARSRCGPVLAVGRGYVPVSALKLVGDRWSLTDASVRPCAGPRAPMTPGSDGPSVSRYQWDRSLIRQRFQSFWRACPRGSCCQHVDETVYLSVLFPGTRSFEGQRRCSVSCSQRGDEMRPDRIGGLRTESTRCVASL